MDLPLLWAAVKTPGLAVVVVLPLVNVQGTTVCVVRSDKQVLRVAGRAGLQAGHGTAGARPSILMSIVLVRNIYYV